MKERRGRETINEQVNKEPRNHGTKGKRKQGNKEQASNEWRTNQARTTANGNPKMGGACVAGERH